MNKVVNNKRNKTCVSAMIVMFTVAILAACSKAPTTDTSEAAGSPAPASSAQAPTGLVKNPVNHGQVADVTRWMDQASTKTAAQIASEEKLAREAKEKQAALDAKKISDTNKHPVLTKAETGAKETPAPVAINANNTPIVAPVVVKAPEPVAHVASAAPTTSKPAEPEHTVLKLVSSVQPKFPGIAARSGVTEGVVSARLHVEPDGRVSQVEILKARPARIFDREVITAASQWKYAPLSKQQTAMVEFNFKMDQ